MSQLNYKRQIIYCAPQKEKQQQQKKKLENDCHL